MQCLSESSLGYLLFSLPRGPSFVWQQKKQKCLSARLLGDLLVFDGEIKRTRLRLRQLLILRHLQTAGARLHNQSAQTSRGNIFLKLKLFLSLSLAATKIGTSFL